MLEYFKSADEILNDNFISEKEKNEAELENVKKQFQIDTLTEEIDQGHVPEILEFYFGGPDDSFFTKLSIHSSTGDLYYDGVNTNESLFDFIVSQKN